VFNLAAVGSALSAALRKHLIWLESLPPQTCEAVAAALVRLGRVLEARSDPRAGLATNSNFTVARFRADALADLPDRRTGALRRRPAQSQGPGRMSTARSGERQESPISAMQSKAERLSNLARSPIVFVIVQETRDPRFQ
jgi:hypothetical protein